MELDLWTQSLVTAMTALWTKVANFIPNLFGALVVLLLGFVVAKLLDTLLSKLLAKLGLDRLMGGTGLTKLLSRGGIQVPISTLVGKIVYWFVLLIFLVSAAESLGLERVSATLDMLALYLPKVFGAALVLLVGVLLAQLANGLVRGAAEGVGLDYAARRRANRPGPGDHHQYFGCDQSVGGQDRPAQPCDRDCLDYRWSGGRAGNGVGKPGNCRSDSCGNLCA